MVADGKAGIILIRFTHKKHFVQFTIEKLFLQFTIEKHFVQFILEIQGRANIWHGPLSFAKFLAVFKHLVQFAKLASRAKGASH